MPPAPTSFRPPPATNWEALAPEAALAALGSARGGLDESEAAARLELVGRNRLPPAHRRSALARLIDQFRNVLIYVLLGAAVVTASIGHWLDAAVILAVVIANAVIGWFQEGRAEEALAAVGKLLAANALVLRAGAKRTIHAADLVPGDVVFVQSGDLVPADLRLLEARSLSIDEAMLTGESVPVVKTIDAVPAGLPLGDRRSLAFSGTIVAAGQGRGLVVATGPISEIGRIGTLVGGVEELETPLLQRLAATGRTLTTVILGLAAATIAIGLLIGRLPADELFLAGIGLAVAAIPEGLPAIVTIILAIGVRRMAARGALIRRLPAVETLGSVTVICTDKTGTLTRNELSARAVVTAGGAYTVEGEGYAPSGRLLDSGGTPATLANDAALEPLLAAAVLCNDARLRQTGADWIVEGDPIEGALLALAARAGVDAAALTFAEPRHDALPFESDFRYMATLNGGATVHVKGAPERLLDLCGTELAPAGAQPLDRAAWHGHIDRMAQGGLRVLAFAAGPRADGARLTREEIGRGLVFLGLVGFIDPPRADAERAVAECRAAGIAVKMITGDHSATALAIGREVGLDVAGGALTDADLATLDGAALVEAAGRVNVFARVEPVQKLRIVEALQAAGHSVAMTGDGVNDAPALRRADIGVAMGRKGSDAARQAAKMVLTDDNFATIANAVREGRTVDDNLRKTLAYILPTNAGEALLLIGAILAGATLPITAIQIIWINFATEVTLSLSLAFEPRARDGMTRRPRPRGGSLIDRGAVLRILFVAAVMAGTAAGLFAFAVAEGRPIEAARTIAVNAVVAAEIAYLLAIVTLRFRRDGNEPGGRAAVNWVALAMVAAVTLLQVAVTEWPPAAQALGLTHLAVGDWALAALAGIIMFGAALAERRLSRRFGRTPPAPATNRSVDGG